MNPTNTQSSERELVDAAMKAALAKGFSAPPSHEPEQNDALPEHERLMPEHEPEQNLNRSLNKRICSDGNCAYDPEDPGPFGWKPRSPLDRLPPEIQETILDVLEVRTFRQAQAYLGRPKSIGGLGLRTSIAALHSFYYRHRADQLDENREMLEEQADYLLAQAGDNDEKFVKAAKHLFKRRLLETAVMPTAETTELRTLFGILDRLTNSELAERRVRLAELKLTTSSENESRANESLHLSEGASK